MDSRQKEFTITGLRQLRTYLFKKRIAIWFLRNDDIVVPVASDSLKSTVSRILDTISYSCPPVKDAIAIDEFKGNADTGKYQCILVNPKQHTVMDILPDRTNPHLSAYFRELDRSQRYRVKFFICDMWQPYVDIAHTYFPNAKVIIDKYHFIRQVTWAIESVRKRLQKTMPVSLRKYYKRSHKLILTWYNKLKDEICHSKSGIL